MKAWSRLTLIMHSSERRELEEATQPKADDPATTATTTTATMTSTTNHERLATNHHDTMTTSSASIHAMAHDQAFLPSYLPT